MKLALLPAAAARPVAALTAVSQRYGKVAALDRASLEIPAGCMVGLVGPDGVGKSSLLALIAGARRVQQGRVKVLGGDMADARLRRPPARASPICRRGWAGTSTPTSSGERGLLRPPVRPGPGRGEARIASCWRSGLAPSPTGRPASSPAG